MDWLDAEIGGVPAAGVVAALGQAGSGKTSLALGFTMAQLKRSQRVCYLTSETPEAVLETARGMLELDLRQYIANGALSLLSFAPFFVNKVRSLNSVDPPLAELKEYFDERHIEHVVFDTLDPMLGWIEAANAKGSVRHMLGQIQSWGRAVLCTMSGTAPAVGEFARLVSGSLELVENKLVVRQAGWCNVYDIEAPLQFVQGRGLIVRKDAGRQPAKKSPHMSDMSLVAAAPMLDSERRPNVGGSGGNQGPGPAAVNHAPWMSLIGDANKIIGPQAVILASADLFAQQTPPVNPPPPPQQSQPPAPNPLLQRTMPTNATGGGSSPPAGIPLPQPGSLAPVPSREPSTPRLPSNHSSSGAAQVLPTGPHPIAMVDAYDPTDDGVTRIANSPPQAAQAQGKPRDDLRATVNNSALPLPPASLDWNAAATNKYQPNYAKQSSTDLDAVPSSSKTIVSPPRKGNGGSDDLMVSEDPTNVMPGASQVPPPPAAAPRPAAGSPAGPPRPVSGNININNNNNNRRR